MVAMDSNSAVPVQVLYAITIVENYVNTLPGHVPDDIREMRALISRLNTLLIKYSSDHHLRYPLGEDDNG